MKKPKKLSVHKEVWESWAKDANKTNQNNTEEKDLINFVETKNYMVFYIKDCSAYIKEFKSLNKAKKFADQFKQDGVANWVDFIIAGEIVLDYNSSGIVRDKK